MRGLTEPGIITIVHIVFMKHHILHILHTQPTKTQLPASTVIKRIVLFIIIVTVATCITIRHIHSR
jgi:hypothetical protein